MKIYDECTNCSIRVKAEIDDNDLGEIVMICPQCSGIVLPCEDCVLHNEKTFDPMMCLRCPMLRPGIRTVPAEIDNGEEVTAYESDKNNLEVADSTNENKPCNTDRHGNRRSDEA